MIKILFICHGKVQMLLDRDVSDPWYSHDYETAYRDIVEGCRRIMEELR